MLPRTWEGVGKNAAVTRVVIIGGGPGGYEAALVAVQNGADVTVVDRDGIGGSAVLTDCVPSKALIAVSDILTEAGESHALGVTIAGAPARPDLLSVDLAQVNARILALADQQSRDTRERGRARGSGFEGPGARARRAVERMGGPFGARRADDRIRDDPALEALEAGVEGEQLMEGGGARAGNAGDDERTDDRLRETGRRGLPARLGMQSSDQAGEQECEDLRAGRRIVGEIALAGGDVLFAGVVIAGAKAHHQKCFFHILFLKSPTASASAAQ